MTEHEPTRCNPGGHASDPLGDRQSRDHLRQAPRAGWTRSGLVDTSSCGERRGVQAVENPSPCPALIHDWDQGCPYASLAFGRRGETAGVRPSMVSVYNCFDNALAENLLLHPRMRAHRRPIMDRSGRGRAYPRPLHRRLVEPALPPSDARLDQPGRVRAAVFLLPTTGVRAGRFRKTTRWRALALCADRQRRRDRHSPEVSRRLGGR